MLLGTPKSIALSEEKINSTAIICTKSTGTTESEKIEFNDLLENIKILIDYIIAQNSKKRNMKKNKLLLNNMKNIGQFLRAPTVKIAEAITGILVSEEKDWKLSAGKIVQAVIKGNFLTQLGREIEQYQNAGKIKEDYFATNKQRATLFEFLKFLDEEVPDEELFRAMKSIFFSGVDVNAKEIDEYLSYEFMNTAKKISGTEILILKANFEIINKKSTPEVKDRVQKLSVPYSRSAWRKIIATQMGYKDIDTIVFKYEKNLESLGLISPRNDDTRFQSDFEPVSAHRYRLTEMGCKFCEFIINYD